MTDDIVERLRTREMMAMILKNKPNLYKDAADEITRLRKYEELVRFIANDYHELSHDKAQWQRDDWKKRCKKLIEEYYENPVNIRPTP
jgi:hypothetical protein